MPSVAHIHDCRVQLVEIPGLIASAAEDRGGGKALGVLRGADAIVLRHAVNMPLAELATVRAELEAAGIEKRTLIAVTKSDESDESDESARPAFRRSVFWCSTTTASTGSARSFGS